MKMKKVNFLITAVIAIFALSSCGGGSTKDGNHESSEAKMVEMSLSEKGIPVTFSAPEGVEITDGLLNGVFDGVVLINYEVKKDNFIMDVLMEDADLVDDLSTYLEYAKGTDIDSDFVEFVKEEENGYIAKLESEDGDNYAFYYVLIKDNRAIEFTEGLNFSDYTLQEIETLYNAAKDAK